MRWWVLLLILASWRALAAEPDWLLVAPQRVAAGEPFELIVIAPPDATLPDEIDLRVKFDRADVVIPARAQGPAQGGRRRYAATARVPQTKTCVSRSGCARAGRSNCGRAC